MEPLFSIVIANYNYGRFLAEAIESAYSQGMGDEVEVIVCDGGSTDNSLEIIKRYKDRLAWWCSEKDDGQSNAFNKGFAHARGRFLTWLNADDVLTHGALKAIANEIAKHPDCEWFAGSSVWTDANLMIHRCFCAHRFSVSRVRCGLMSVGGPSSFFTPRLLAAAGGFDETLHYKMDTDLWYRFFFKCGARYRRTRHNIFAYRQHEASKMSGADSHATERALANRRRALEEGWVLKQRYGGQTGWRAKFTRLATLSLVDHLVVMWRNFKWKGMRATEI